MEKCIFILNGPNLNLLGLREPEKYGTTTLAEVEEQCEEKAAALGVHIEFRQTNHEGVLIDWVQEARQKAAGIIINAAGYTHTSVALLDALLAAEKPVIELHITDIKKREPFRHHSYVALVAKDEVVGQGVAGYGIALEKMVALIG